MCVRALYGPYNNAKQIGKMREREPDILYIVFDVVFSGQFISFYSSVLGANMFKFYLLDVTEKIKYLLGKNTNIKRQVINISPVHQTTPAIFFIKKLFMGKKYFYILF